MSDMQESTITTRGQTTVPREVRDVLALRPGDKLRYLILEGGEVRLLRRRPLSDLAGLLARPGAAPVSLDQIEHAIAEGGALQP